MAKGEFTVWCLLGKKAGDNTQVCALADQLGFGSENKRIVARPWELLCHLGGAVTLAGINRSASTPLAPPWPDIVITAGRRNEPVARWIRRQSGGHARLVHIGRPWAPLDAWDLVVTTPQYFLPEQANILHNRLPLNRVTATELAAAGTQLLPQLAALPRPWLAVLAGGDSGRFVMTPKKGEQLGKLAQALASASGGTLLVTDSPRTPVAAGDALRAQLRGPHFCYCWRDGGANPYRGLLALADAFVVTGESMSMLGEAVETGKPLYIFDLGDDDAHWWRLAHNYRYKPLSHRFAMQFGPHRMRRDVGRIQDALVASGRARWLTPALVPEAATALRARSSAAVESDAPGVAKMELVRAADAVRRLVTSR